MPPTAVATPTLLTDPGYLFWAPLGSAEPAGTVVGSVFTDAWPVAWLPLGATEEGSQFNYEINVEAVTVAEFLDPVAQRTTERSGSIAFSLASWTLTNLKRAMNGGALTVSGATTTTKSTYEPPDPGSEVRAMIGWESLDNTARLVCRQVINAATIEAAFRKAPDKALIPCEFRFEVPAAAKPFMFSAAGVARG
ncbi:MAG: hypothetical protein LC798_10835 [Chloroflexi bacterium]|nr:hypothetical protein [Chloroflexota bacterium]